MNIELLVNPESSPILCKKPRLPVSIVILFPSLLRVDETSNK